MDVTSLLNQSAGSNACKEASRESTPSAIGGASTLPSTALPTPSPERASPHREGEAKLSRGRTPWNAGGYSLPLQPEPKFRSTSMSEQLDSETSYHTPAGTSAHSRDGSRDGSMDSDMASSRDAASARPQPIWTTAADSQNRPFDFSDKRLPSWDKRRSTDYELSNSPRHKFSDSHSSLSSYGSWQSRSHSRISSMTTISGGYNVGSSLAELPILEAKLAEHDEARRRRPQGDGETSLSALPKQPVAASIEADKPERPGSPSDAILNIKGLSRPRQNWESPRPALNRASHLFSSPKLHKRATSAPDFTPASAYLPSHPPRQPYAVLPPPHRAMVMSANGPGGASDRGEGRGLVEVRENGAEGRAGEAAAAVARATPVGPGSSPELASHGQQQPSSRVEDEASAPGGDPEEPRCMFVANCDTGSQLRKAISHLFGRNKSCTLKIPKEVWVYYCRKHYQRIRYRNARTYPSNQMELVKVQIRRLQAWSEGNKAKGSGPYIKQWTLSLRKREQNRLESGKGTADEGGDDDHVAAPGGSAVPDWIIQRLGDGYATDKMLDIAENLHKDIADGILSQVPEIEFLPDIDDDEGASAKPSRARRQNSANGGSSKTPKRKAADVPNMVRQSSASGDGAYSDPHEDDDGAELVSPSGKRARLGGVSGVSGVPYHQPPDLAPARPMHAYMVPAYGDGRGGHGLPPRAAKVVPKMRPLEYNHHGFAQAEYDHQGQPRLGHLQHGMGGGGGPVYGGAYVQHPARLASGSGHGHGADGPPTLPSISAQIPRCGPYPPPMPRFGDSRPMHQRSASAYTPASRVVPASTRPSSSGNGAPAVPSRFRLGDAGPAVYDGPQGVAAGRWFAQPYGQAQQAWGPDYGHGFAPPQAPIYGQAGPRPDEASPRSGPSYGNTLQAYNAAEDDA